MNFQRSVTSLINQNNPGTVYLYYCAISAKKTGEKRQFVIKLSLNLLVESE